MADKNDKLERFRQIVLNDAARERDLVLSKVAADRKSRVAAAKAEIRRETNQRVHEESAVIRSETGREVSRRMLEHKRIIATRREGIAHEVFAAVREKILAFTQTPDYLEHLKKLYLDGFSAIGNPYDGVILLRPQDMQYSKALAALSPGRHVTFQEGTFTLGGLIIDCQSKLLRADQTYDTALGDLDGHFAELFGLSIADD